MSRLALYLLGTPRIERDGVPVKLGRHKAIALLAYLATTGESHQRHSEAELHRLRAELLLAQAGDAGENSGWHQAECGFQRAIEVARCQQAKSWELRATIGLARLWQEQGKQHKARQALAEVYGWFTEGFDTADLRQARALLSQLS